MTREDFIAQAAAEFYGKGRSETRVPAQERMEDAIKEAVELADLLETEGAASWGRAPSPDLGFLSVGMIQIGPGPAALKNILGDLAAKYPPETAVPAGSWELGFKPVPPERLKSGIIVPGRS